MDILIPEIFEGLFDDAKRYYVYFGGRGSGKSHSIARYLIVKSLEKPIKILCAREFQNSIAESVHSLLSGIIEKYELTKYFTVKINEIECVNGSQFIFKGLAHNIESVKSTEGIDIAWIEEGDKVSQLSWDTLIPTIRKPNSKILVTFNPAFEDDPVYKMFITNKMPDSITQKVNWNHNPHFPDVLKKEMEHMRETDYEKYRHVWEGELRTVSDSQVFRSKYIVQEFDYSNREVFYHGMDFGFSNDPSVIIKDFVENGYLYIADESYGYHVELPDLDKLIKKVTDKKNYKIYADNSRPETISFLKNTPYNNNIHPCDKWQGSVEDGIEFIKSFKKVIIHPKCVKTIEEFNRYSYKLDKKTGAVLPILLDAYNHCIDAIRYSLNDLIKRKTSIYDEGFF